MNKDILFISDLHLGLDKPEITKCFLNFLKNRARDAEAVYILGDLFDAWIGDDDRTPPNQTIRNHLKALTDDGVSVFLQPGNRDFLIGTLFSSETGIKILSDYHVIELNSVRTLLTHGDLLCTDDIAYQQFRIRARSQNWQKQVLSKPLWLRLIAVRWYRLRSYFHKRGKSTTIMDVNYETVVSVMKDHDCLRLIHGHTHRPGKHSLTIDHLKAERIVLSDWRKNYAEVLCWSDNTFKIETL